MAVVVVAINTYIHMWYICIYIGVGFTAETVDSEWKHTEERERQSCHVCNTRVRIIIINST